MLRRTILFLLALKYAFLDVADASSSAGDWNYHHGAGGPDDWYKQYPAMCSGKIQSPVAVNYGESTFSGRFGSIQITLLNGSTGDYTLKNTGSSVTLSFPDNTWGVKIVRNGDLFVVANIHFHWGSKSTIGSEHTLNGNYYPLELHMVTYKRSMYSNLATAAASPSGLAVVGLLFRVDDSIQANDNWKPMAQMTNAFSGILKAGENITYPRFDLAAAFSGYDLSKFYRYPGSLTTPPCTQNVFWTLLNQVATIKSSELDRFRTLSFDASFGAGPMEDNFRNVQPFNPQDAEVLRVMERSWNSANGLTVGKLQLILPSSISLLLFMALY